jgi:hypothetical protein
MALVMETVLDPGTAGTEDHRRSISVLYTSEEETIAALATADALASRWEARITVLAPQVVPFPRQLSDPPVRPDVREQQLGALIRKARVETTAHVYLCRDRKDTLLTILPEHSLVVIGSRRRWWHTGEERLAEMLRRAGHDVIVSPVE